MAADYDLVILGGTLAGRGAALAAVGYGARVALVEPPGVFARRQQAKYLLRGLQQLGEGRSRQAVSEWFELAEKGAERVQRASVFDWPGLVRWSAIAAETQQPQLSVDALSVQGVDVILAMPARLSRQLVVSVAGRKLKTRGVLAAFGSVPLPIVGLSGSASSSLLTGIESLLERPALPQRVSVWGDSCEAVEWAQALNALGVNTSLVGDDFLPDEDSSVRGWVQRQLIATGIRLVAPSQALTGEHRSEDSHIHLQLGRTKPALILPDFIYHPAGGYPDVDPQILDRTDLRSNQYLQTAHARVFACGSVIHGRFAGEATAQAEAQRAVWNALFLPNKQVGYSAIPHSHYRFARVGPTPRFAKEGYAPTGDYTVFVASSANSADLTRPLPYPSYCKLICQKGRLQSIHLLGDGADQLAPLLAAMAGKPIYQLLLLAERSPAPLAAEGLAGLVRAAASQSQQARWQPYHWRRDWAENWFNWRRSRQA